MNTSRSGMTLFELLIVTVIIAIVYSIGLFTLKKERVTDNVLSLSTLKTTLLALSYPGKIRLLCDTSKQECTLFSGDGKIVSTAHLRSSGPIQRYGFDHFGELKALGDVVTQSGDKLVQSSFEMSLYPDGVITPLILKNNNLFYVYTPIGEEKPFITQSEEELRKFLFNEGHYPLKGDDAYVSR